MDTTKPQININSEKPLNYSVGQNVLISSATAYDVLGETTNVKLTVTLIGSNDVISDVNGNVLQGVDANQDYQFKAVKDGRYRIVYSVADNFNKQIASTQLLATVNELEKPIIQLSGNVPSSGKVGKPIKLPMKIKEKINLDVTGLTNHGPIMIVAFGDSVTHGAMGFGEINYEDVYWNRLRKKINAKRNYVPVNIINAGIGGITAAGSLERLDSQVLVHRPDLVIVCFGLNDVNGSLQE